MTQAKLIRGSSAIEAFASRLSPGLALLMGAGASYPSPSSLPTVRAIEEELVASLSRSGSEGERLLALFASEGRTTVFDFVRFEQAIEALILAVADVESFIPMLFDSQAPNRYHYQAARLLDAGSLLLTTNFDCLLETACLEQRIPYTPIVTDADFERTRNSGSAPPNPILKLHGSISVVTGRDPQFVEPTITMRRLTAVDYRSAKWTVLGDTLAERDLLVMGYSGFDDVDIMPQIARGSRGLLWIVHTSEPEPILWSGDQGEIPEELVRRWGGKLHHYFGRLYGDALLKPRRGASDVLILSAQTESVFDRLVGVSPTDPAGGSRVVDTDEVSSRVHRFGVELREQFRRRPESRPHLAALLYFVVQEFDTAVEYATEALSLCRTASSALTSARVHDLLARIWRNRDVMDAAVAHSIAAVRHYEANIPHLRSDDLESLDELREFASPSNRDVRAKRWSLMPGAAAGFIVAERALLAGNLLDARTALTKFFPDLPHAGRWDLLMGLYQLIGNYSTNYDALDNYVTLHFIATGRFLEITNDKIGWAYALLCLAIVYASDGADEWAEDEADSARILFEAAQNDLGRALSLFVQSCALWELGREQEFDRTRLAAEFAKQEWQELTNAASRGQLCCPQCSQKTMFNERECGECHLKLPAVRDSSLRFEMFAKLIETIGHSRTELKGEHVSIPVDWSRRR